MKSVFLYLCVCICSTFAVNHPSYRFDYEYSKEVDGWFKFHQVPADFMTAFQRCKAEGAILASPLNKQILKIMINIQKYKTNGVYDVLTGVHATFSKGDYFSVEGVPLLKMPVSWAPNEPDNYRNNVDCTIMYKNGTMAANRCDDSYLFICFRHNNNEKLNACGTLDEEYTLDASTGSCYKFHRVARTWRRAAMTCAAEGGHLAIINSETEMQVLKEIFASVPKDEITCKNNHIISLGINDWGERGVWYTLHGETIQEAGYSTFESGQPNNSTKHDGGSFCGGMYRNGLLDDIWCNEVNYPFICEKKPDSLLTKY